MGRKRNSTFAAGARRCTAAVAATATAFILAAASIPVFAAGSVSLEKGSSVQLSSQVSLEGEYDVTTTWSMTGASSADTSIDENGLLTIGEDEASSALTVIAAMTVTRTGSDGAGSVETFTDSTTVIVTEPGTATAEEEENEEAPALVGGQESTASAAGTTAPAEPVPQTKTGSKSESALPEEKVEAPENAGAPDNAGHTVESVKAADPQTGDTAAPGLYGGIIAAVLAMGGALGLHWRKHFRSAGR